MKKNGLIIFILVLIIIGLISFICYDKGVFDKKSKKIDNSYENKVVEVTDNNTLEDISKKIDCLFTYCEESNSYEKSKTYSDYGFRYKVLKKELSEADKQFIVLSTASWDNITGDEWKSNSYMKTWIERDLEESYSKNYAFTSNKQLTAKKVNDYSVKLFGTKINNPIERMGKCPLFIYDDKTLMYYRPEPRCGGTSAAIVSRYISKVTSDDEKLYAYISFGFVRGDENGDLKVYSDIDVKDSEISFGSIEAKNMVDSIIDSDGMIYYEIDESNYEKFSSYKFTFTKDSDGNYYFTNVTQEK